MGDGNGPEAKPLSATLTQVRGQIRPLLDRYVPILGWLPGYPRDWLRPELIAAVTSWGVMVPVAMAYAELAGVGDLRIF